MKWIDFNNSTKMFAAGVMMRKGVVFLEQRMVRRWLLDMKKG